MNKKVIVLILFTLLLCGCTADVNIDIKDNKIYEEISINSFSNDTTSKENILNGYRNYIPVYYDIDIIDTEPDTKKSNITYYDREVTDLGTGYNIKYSHTYDYDDYTKARTFKKAFKSASFVVDSDNKEHYILSTDNSGIQVFDVYSDLTSVRINITVDGDVIETNGVKKNDTYTWSFTRNDKVKKIYIKYKNKENKEVIINQTIDNNTSSKKEETQVEKFANSHPIILIIVGISVTLFIIVFAIKINNKKYD